MLFMFAFFRMVYYFLYRMFNNYYIAKNKVDSGTRKYLYNLFIRVLDDIENTSDEEKLAMYNIVSNWSSFNRVSLKVYGKTEQGFTNVGIRPGFFVVYRIYSTRHTENVLKGKITCPAIPIVIINVLNAQAIK